MSGPGDIWRQAAGKWTEVSTQIGDDQWELPTTCEGWTVRDLVDHAMHWQAMGGGMLGAGTSPGQDWSVIEAALSAALDDPSNLEGSAPEFDDMPKHQVLGFVIGDLLIHSWDLARSIGADDTLPAEAVEATYFGLTRVPAEVLRSTDMFDDPVEIDDDASPQDRLIAFTGRRP